MNYIFNDGGRAAAGFKGKTGDCVCRAIAIATEHSYQEIYSQLNTLKNSERITKRQKRKSSARIGVRKKSSRIFLESMGWMWTPTMLIGQGCKVHLVADELPAGRLIVQVSRHMTAVIDGVIHDTYDPSRNGKRCVYGYFTKSELAGT